MMCSTISGKRQIGRFLAQPLDQPHEGADGLPGPAGQRGGGVVQAGIDLVGGRLQVFQRTRADAAGRKIDDAQEGGVVVRVAEQSQVGQRVLDFLALEEAQAAIDLVRHALGEQFVFEDARLGVGAVEDGALGRRDAIAHQFADLVDDEARLVEVGIALEGADRLAGAGIGPQVLAQALAVVLDERVGGGQDIAVRTVVLLQADDVGAGILALEVAHVADFGAAEGVDALVVVADREDLRPAARQQLQPGVLQAVGILELVDQDVAEAFLVVGTQRFVALQQFMTAQEQFGEIDDALAVALVFILGIQFDALLRVMVVSLGLSGAHALLLVGVDEMAQLARRVFLVVDVQVLQQAPDHRQLVGGIEDLEGLRQPGLAAVGAQQPVAQAVEGADPHAARVDRHQRRQPRGHLPSRLVGEGHRQDAVRPGLVGRHQPGDARGQHTGLAAAGAGEDQRMHRRQRHRLPLRRVQMGQEVGHEAVLSRKRRWLGALRGLGGYWSDQPVVIVQRNNRISTINLP
jgi:hypothetical protein